MREPDDREYTTTHEWLRLDGENATLGITEHALKGGGEECAVTYEPPGTALKRGDIVAHVMWPGVDLKVRTPLSGTLIAVNERLQKEPRWVASDPYEEGWLVRLRVEAGEEIEHLEEPEVYRKRVARGEGEDI